MDRPNLFVQTDSHVRRIEFKHGRAIGVVVRTSEGDRTIGCRREVVLCAGAIGSPHLLQHSGIGDPERLRSLGIDVVANAPQVGQNLQDHLFGHVKVRLAHESHSLNADLTDPERLARAMQRWAETGTGILNTTSSQILAFVASHADRESPDVQLAMRPLSFGIDSSGVVGIDSFPGMTVSSINAQPASRGTVQITSRDRGQRAEIQTRYLSDPRDVEVLIAGIRRLREILSQPALTGRVVEEIEPGADVQSDAALEDYLRQTVSTVYHPTGICRMGADREAVVDPQLRVRGVRGLRVVDASVMPRITSGNTQAPAILIGEKGADLILAEA